MPPNRCNQYRLDRRGVTGRTAGTVCPVSGNVLVTSSAPYTQRIRSTPGPGLMKRCTSPAATWVVSRAGGVTAAIQLDDGLALDHGHLLDAVVRMEADRRVGGERGRPPFTKGCPSSGLEVSGTLSIPSPLSTLGAVG